MILASVFEGWEGYQRSLEHAVAALTSTQLAWRPAAGVRSLGEVIRHLALGRITWFARMNAPDMDEVLRRVPEWHVNEEAVPADDVLALAEWLCLSWQPIQATLEAWSVDDLLRTYRLCWDGQVYAISRQWTVWRVLSHDHHHGGQIALMLAMQGIPAHELRALGGHITAPPLAVE